MWPSMRLRRSSISSISRCSTFARSKLPTAFAASKRPLESAISRERFSKSIHSDEAIGSPSLPCRSSAAGWRNSRKRPFADVGASALLPGHQHRRAKFKISKWKTDNARSATASTKALTRRSDESDGAKWSAHFKPLKIFNCPGYNARCVVAWNQLTPADVERAREELDRRRTEMLARHADE